MSVIWKLQDHVVNGHSLKFNSTIDQMMCGMLLNVLMYISIMVLYWNKHVFMFSCCKQFCGPELSILNVWNILKPRNSLVLVYIKALF